MTEKVKLSREQEEAFEVFKACGFELINFIEGREYWNNQFAPLKDMSIDKFARLLYEPDSYEVEPNYKVGDWVVITEDHDSKGKILQIKIADKTLLNLDYGNGFQSWWPVSSLRYATPEEIKAEQERRVWAKVGRKPYEVKDDDVMIIREGRHDNSLQVKDFDRNELHQMLRSGDIVGFYPAESFISFGGGEDA